MHQFSLEQKKLLTSLENQLHRYGELVYVLDEILDEYFEFLDDEMVNPDALHIISLAPELDSMRSDLADIFDKSLYLKKICQSQVERFKRLGEQEL